MKPITICMTYFKSLTLANFAAAFHSVCQQDLTQVEEVVIVDNDTDDPEASIQVVIDSMAFPVPVKLFSYKHGDATRTHAWSTNVAVALVHTPWILFTRADYLLDFDLLEKLSQKIESGRDVFITAHGYHLNVDVAECEKTGWRQFGLRMFRVLSGAVIDYTEIDAGVWLSTRAAFCGVGGLDTSLSAWGHAQTHFQYKLSQAGVQFACVPKILFYHTAHAASRDIELAHQQLRDKGVDLKQMWARHEGVQPYL